VIKYDCEGLMLKLQLQYCGHLMRRADSLEKTLMLGKIESRRRRLLGRETMFFVGVPLNIKNGDGMIVRPVVFVY